MLAGCDIMKASKEVKGIFYLPSNSRYPENVRASFDKNLGKQDGGFLIGVTMNKRNSIDAKKRSAVYHKTGGFCFYCGAKLESQHVTDWAGKVVSTIPQWNVHHLKALSQGGTNDLDNLVPVCIPCHGREHR